jgi:recombinational DNA repair ATPase RecF
VITELYLKNFRGFEDHVVPLKPFTVIVGRNNAGKSTIAEALRLISLVVSRFKGDLGSIPVWWESEVRFCFIIASSSESTDRIWKYSQFAVVASLERPAFPHGRRRGRVSVKAISK